MMKRIKNFDEFNGAKVFPATPETQPEIKTQLPFGTDPTLFWTIFVAILTGAFVLGQYFGSTKFDKEKSDYYDEIKTLQKDTIRLNSLINEKDSNLKSKDSLLEIKSDSLVLINKNINNLYLLLAKYSKNK